MEADGFMDMMMITSDLLLCINWKTFIFYCFMLVLFECTGISYSNVCGVIYLFLLACFI